MTTRLSLTDRPEPAATLSRTRAGEGVGTAATFWVFAAVYGVFMFAASAPSPLYGVYATKFDFSPSTLTVVFAVYAIALLAALLVTGRLSDHLGRRPVILASIAFEIVAMLCFILADTTSVLIVGRVVQGLATGAALAALSAGIIELAGTAAAGIAAVVTAAAPSFGLALGAIASSALVQYAPHPTRLVYWLIITALTAGAAAVARAPEPGQRRPGALRSLVPVATIPPHTRASFAAVTPSTIAAWALSGFYLSLGPTLVARIENSTNHLWGGLAVLVFTTAAGTIGLATRRLTITTALLAGPSALTAGVLVSLLAITTSNGATFLVGSIIAGTGFGTGFIGGMRAISQTAQPSERAGVLAAFYTMSYLAFSLPVIAAGIAQTHSDAQTVATAFTATVAVLGAVGALTNLRTSHARRRRTASA